MLTASGVAENVACNIEVLPDDQSLDGTELKCLECVFDTKAVFRCILADLVEVTLDQLLLLHELDVRQRLRRQLDSLGRVEARNLPQYVARHT